MCTYRCNVSPFCLARQAPSLNAWPPIEGGGWPPSCVSDAEGSAHYATEGRSSSLFWGGGAGQPQARATGKAARSESGRAEAEPEPLEGLQKAEQSNG